MAVIKFRSEPEKKRNLKHLHVFKVICNSDLNVYSTTFNIIILKRKYGFPCCQEKSLSLKNYLKEIKTALKTMSLYLNVFNKCDCSRCSKMV